MSMCYSSTSPSFYKHHIPTLFKPVSISTRTIKPIIRTNCTPPSDDDDTNDIHQLLKILPHDLRHNLVMESKRDQLLEVILDLGRLPEARYLGDSGRRYLRDTEVNVSFILLFSVLTFNLLHCRRAEANKHMDN
ncbi:hypothetical protein M8C21_003341 [Ambrosia artemisiifolia]|uniref:Uncharacterized protein n=1 Tax=Ambrosia artemisiifolia TaxID=4212 RepID=A0AAD5BR22_AMBAR|nr:hypothetical protein M8C21_003341 [Ambrosia artemisiifolia]